MPELKKLCSNLENSFRATEPLEEIVNFFDYVSKWHDRGLHDFIELIKETNYGHFDQILKNLETLQLHFINAGRTDFGMNRTEKGQSVVPATVFLGNIYGLWTKPVSVWMQTKDRPKGGWGFSGMEHLNAYDVVSDQARSFMVSHIKPMISIINDLESTLA
jgi:hypothetical protein